MPGIMEDVRFLSETLPDRESQSEEEERAAEYIHGRLSSVTPDTEIEPFSCVDNWELVVASYLAEFLLVALAAVWWPLPAALYGGAVAFSFLAEWSGRPVFSRLLPAFDSANVVARMEALRPRRVFLLTARYDSGPATLLTAPGAAAAQRALHRLLLLAMTVVIATCVVEGAALLGGAQNPAMPWFRWAAAAVLGVGAAVYFAAAAWGGDAPGANGNASGVAALLRVAEMLREAPLADSDVWMAATGAHGRGRAGVRALLEGAGLDKALTHVINLESVGRGALRHTVAEGMPVAMPAGALLRAAAGSVGEARQVPPARLTSVATDAHTALAGGWKALSIVGLDTDGVPCGWQWTEDTADLVEQDQIERAAAFAVAVMRELEGLDHD